MDTGIDPTPGSYIAREFSSSVPEVVAPPHPSNRPLGVTMLAWMSFALAAFFLIAAIAVLIEPLRIPDEMKLDSIADRALVAGVFLCFAALEYLCGRAFWKLRNWVRALVIALSVVGLVLPEPRSGVFSRAFSLLVFWYLLQPHVRDAFDASSSGGKSFWAAERLN